MGVPEKQKIIFGELATRIRVAVEVDGFQSGDSPENIFDAYEQTGNLSQLEDVERRVGQMSQETPENFKEIRTSIEEIRKDLSDFSNQLAKNAEIGKVDPTKIDPKIFNKLGRQFEQRNRKKLVLVSPSYFL